MSHGFCFNSMPQTRRMNDRQTPILKLEDGGFMAIVLIVSLAFTWLLLPFFGAILWGLVAAILFAPVNRKLVGIFGGHRNLASALTLILILILFILPAAMLATALVEQAAELYVQVQTGQIDIGRMVANLHQQLPAWVARLLDNAAPKDMDSARDLIGSGVASGLQNIASQALGFGQGALRFFASLGVMLYLTFFLLRDGRELGSHIARAIPLRPALRDELVRHFVVVVRATMKGSVVIAMIQGILGGLIFWALGLEGALLWGLMMGVFSLVPAVGTGIVWVPVAVYLFVTGSPVEGAVLTFCGIFIIGLVDNLLRPYLVGHDTRMPDFVVLISTLAGIELFGLNGFIIGPVIAALFMAVWKLVAERLSISAQDGVVP